MQNHSIFRKIKNRKTNRGGSRTAATSKMELFVIIVNGCQPLTIITKCSILDVAAVLDPPLTPLSNRDFIIKSNQNELFFISTQDAFSFYSCISDSK